MYVWANLLFFSFLNRSLLFSMAWQLAPEQERVFLYFEHMYTVYAHMPSDDLLAKCKLKLTFCNWALDTKLTDWILIKRESILPLNHKFAVFLSNRTGDTRFSNFIFMEQTQPKDNIFLTQSEQGSKQATWRRVLKHPTFPWRKLKITKCEQRTIETSSILPFEWTVCVRYMYMYNGRYHFSTRSLEYFKVAFKQ